MRMQPENDKKKPADILLQREMSQRTLAECWGKKKEERTKKCQNLTKRNVLEVRDSPQGL